MKFWIFRFEMNVCEWFDNIVDFIYRCINIKKKRKEEWQHTRNNTNHLVIWAALLSFPPKKKNLYISDNANLYWAHICPSIDILWNTGSLLGFCRLHSQANYPNDLKFFLLCKPTAGRIDAQRFCFVHPHCQITKRGITKQNHSKKQNFAKKN